MFMYHWLGFIFYDAAKKSTVIVYIIRQQENYLNNSFCLINNFCQRSCFFYFKSTLESVALCHAFSFHKMRQFFFFLRSQQSLKLKDP